jgi:predicted nucleotidyltransferase component of viral defense system
MPIYDKNEIGRAAQQHGFVRDTFEKVLRLKEVLRFLNEEEYLKEHLLLKGGTAINLTVFDLPRLSVDIDMDYTPNDTKEDMMYARERITNLIKEYMETEGYQLSMSSRFTHSLDAFYYQYKNSGGNRDMLKIEVNYSLRAHILEPVHRKILPKAFDDGMTVYMVAPIEIFAAKGNALISRAAARDLYDWGNLIRFAEIYSQY